MNIVDINEKYHDELIKSVQTGKIDDFKELYFSKLSELITLLELINTDFILCYLFLYQFLYLQISLYNKYSFVIRMVLLLRFR